MKRREEKGGAIENLIREMGTAVFTETTFSVGRVQSFRYF